MKDPYETESLLPAPNIYQNANEIVNEQLDIADTIIKRAGIPKEQAHAYAIVLAGDKTGLDLTAYASYIKAMKPPEQLQLPESSSTQSLSVPQDQADFESHYSLRKLAEYLKQPENAVRADLEKLGVLALVNSRWQITRYGEQFAKLFWLTPMSPYDLTPRPHIRYNPKAKELLLCRLK